VSVTLLYDARTAAGLSAGSAPTEHYQSLFNKDDQALGTFKETVLTVESPVLFDTLTTRSGHKIGVLTLNAPKAMNAVDLTMVNLIDKQLKRWEKSDKLVAVLMRGAGDKAFCAGGDIRQLYDSMQAEGDEHCRYADNFFSGEYGKNYRVHLFSKPLIAWGNGFVMGGGLGLFIGANHRVGTETLKLAWPEVRIGLFPDVAATWYLSRLPYPAGHWMGLSGSHMNAVDCKDLKLTHYCLQHAQLDEVLAQLRQQNWSDNQAENHYCVRSLLQQLEGSAAAEMPASQLQPVQAELDELFACDDLSKIAARFAAHSTDNAWLQQGLSNFKAGCPATAHLIMEQLHRGKQMSLKEVVQWELVLAYQSVRHPDFAEGIRAMVVDKDFSPRWQHAHVDDVPASWIEALLESPWPQDKHPLAGI